MMREENEIFYYAAEGSVSDLEKHIKKYPSSLHSKDHRNRTPLAHTALTDKEKNAQLLLKKGLSWWDEDSNGGTAIHWATKCASIRVIRMILQNGKTPTSPLMCAAGVRLPQAVNVVLLLGKRKPPALPHRTIDGQTALHLAVAADNIPVVDALLNELGAPIHVHDNDYRTPLHYAADMGNLNAIEKLTAKGLKNTKDRFNVSCAHYAAQNSGKAMALLLKTPTGTYREVKDGENRSCFMWAVVAGNIDAIEFLLQNCPPSRHEIDSHGLTALHLAALMGNERVCKILIKQGWHLSGGDKNFATPIHLAAGRGHTDVVSCLVTAGADMKAVDFMDRTAIFASCFGGQAHTLYVMIRELGFEWRTAVENQSRPITDAMGRTPLHAAAYGGFSHCITQMLKIEEEDPTALCIPLVGAVDNNSETALHVASYRGRLDCVLVLLNHGAAINAVDHNLRTPYKCALDAGHKAVADHLRAQGALLYDELCSLAATIIQNWIRTILEEKKMKRKIQLQDPPFGNQRKNSQRILEKND
ncbi:unnamed protein product, partial [Mesorhabditis belari]|uniref:Inversin n=1 Tax=Mesorhabditis belari TaxID=2138241 RepID=A0AAF3ELD4_9BILA